MICSTNYLLTGRNIRDSIWVEDVTENREKLHEARILVAQNYSRLSSQELTERFVYDDLCCDEYHHRGLSRTFLASGINPDTGIREALGTVRTVLGSKWTPTSDLEPLEIMSLVRPHEGWENFGFEGFRATEAVELSRFTISPQCRGKAAEATGLTQLLTRRLFEAARRSALPTGARQCWSIMPTYVVRAVQAASIELAQSPSVSLNYARHETIFLRYDRYWLKCSPQLFRMRPGRLCHQHSGLDRSVHELAPVAA